MRFTKIPNNTFEKLQLNAGMVLTSFNPAAPAIVQSAILGATTGGLTFQASATYRDNGADIDNCPKNMLELKVLESWEVTLSGTLLTIDAAAAKRLSAAADADPLNANHIVPRGDLAASDFGDIWLVGDYSDNNDEAGGGFFAVHIKNALSTGGFQIKTADKEKGQFAFVFTGHYSINAQTTPPFEIYISEGVDSAFSVQQTLSHVTSGFAADSIAAGETLEVALTAEEGYTIANVVVLYGGADVTSTKWSSGTGKVTIASVAADVEIIATATET